MRHVQQLLNCFIGTCVSALSAQMPVRILHFFHAIVTFFIFLSYLTFIGDVSAMLWHNKRRAALRHDCESYNIYTHMLTYMFMCVGKRSCLSVT